MTRLSTLLDEIDSGTVLLPEFQRGYVWNRDQVRGLMRSLYRGYPVGGLLIWETTSDDIPVRGSAAGSGTRQLLLDGQQRVTSMYGVIRGTAERVKSILVNLLQIPALTEVDRAACRQLVAEAEQLRDTLRRTGIPQPQRCGSSPDNLRTNP